jgi:flagellar basal-body rod modification protein FlgD
MVDSVTASSLAQDVASTQKTSQKLSQDFDDFLVLLTTQMQNQDPLSPMDSTEFTNQLVGFSQVEQQINQNEKLEQMLSLQLSSMSTIALDYVGMEVSYIGNSAHYNGEDPVAIRYVINGDAVDAKLRVLDEKGNIVKTIKLDTTGDNDVIWDGTNDEGNAIDAGNYTFRVDALDSDDGAVQVSTAVPGEVVGIEAQDGIVQLLLEGDYIIPMGSVITAREPITQESLAAQNG